MYIYGLFPSTIPYIKWFRQVYRLCRRNNRSLRLATLISQVYTLFRFGIITKCNKTSTHFCKQLIDYEQWAFLMGFLVRQRELYPMEAIIQFIRSGKRFKDSQQFIQEVVGNSHNRRARKKNVRQITYRIRTYRISVLDVCHAAHCLHA